MYVPSKLVQSAICVRNKSGRSAVVLQGLTWHKKPWTKLLHHGKTHLITGPEVPLPDLSALGSARCGPWIHRVDFPGTPYYRISSTHRHQKPTNLFPDRLLGFSGPMAAHWPGD